MKIGFAGTDGRTLLSAIVVATAKSERGSEKFEGVVIRGTSAMPEFARIFNWPVSFIPTQDNSVASYSASIVEGLKGGRLDYVIPMPEDLFYQGIVDEVMKAGFGERIAGFTREGSFVEGDKIACKRLCKEFNIPVADEWFEVDARQWKEVLKLSLYLIDKFGGAVIKYPYSAGGKGSRIVLDSWQVREVYEQLISDYGKNYKRIFGEDKKWPLLIESRMSGVEVSFTAFVDKEGNFQILPTAMDYPERFSGPASKDNPITGGMGSISPHPVETEELIEMARVHIFEPFVKALKAKNILRPCILYPGCIVSLDPYLKPTRIRMCEMNIRVGEPEFQVVAKRLRNLGYLIRAMFEGKLNEVQPEVRHDQVSMTIALVTGPGGPEGQKGYPWSYTVNETVEVDFEYFRKKNIWLIPSAMQYNEKYKSGGSRVAYLIANTAVKEGESVADATERLRKKLLEAFDAGKIRVIPRENPSGNRLDLRRDVGYHYAICEKTFLKKDSHGGVKSGK